MSFTIIFVIVLLMLFLSAAIKVLREYERGVIFKVREGDKHKGTWPYYHYPGY